MEFFYGHDTLTSLQWAIRAVTVYFFLVFVTKIMGHRSISQGRMVDFIIALIIGNIIANPLSDEKVGLTGSIVSTCVLVALYLGSILLSLNVKSARRFVEPPPIPIIENGEIIYKNLLKAKISIDYLVSHARKEKIEDLKKIALALWEPDGTISFFLNPEFQAATKKDLHISTEKFSLPKTVVKEGKIEKGVLRQMGIDEAWLEESIRSNYQIEIKQILLATMDANKDVKVFLYS